MNPKQTIEAVGRVLSSRNSARLETLFLELGKILLDSKVMSTDDLKSLIDGKFAASEETEPGEQVEAGGFLEDAEAIAWERALNETLNLFRWRSMDVYRISQDEISSDKSRETIVSEMVEDLYSFLKKHFAEVPLNSRKVLSPAVNFYCSKAEDAVSEEESTTIEFSIPIDIPVAQIQAAAKSAKRGRKTTTTNQQPFAGVLFRIDEPSESAPAKGPGVPLYVPMAVAQAAMHSVVEAKGLPLDVDDSLSRHAQKEITGVMNSAEINGQDFVVKGHLFPWSQEEKVSLIEENREILGMSMNATATGRKQIVNGQQVFWIDDLELLGANILLAEKATYRKTRVLSAEAAPSEREIYSIAAHQKEENSVNLEEQLSQMSKTLTEIAAASRQESEVTRTTIEKLSDRLAEQQKVLDSFVVERNERNKQVQAQSQEAEMQSRQSSLVEALAQAFDDKLKQQKEELLNIVNPSRSPKQITSRPIPLVQASAATPQTREEILAADLQDELRDCNSRLSALRESNVIGPARAKLVERIREIKHQLGIH